ncbi:FkbM family methyltransferase [bacterium]|nr:FkbM family methyltransferase [bacterium]
MFPKTKVINGYAITYFNDKELDLIQKEIFTNKIYDVEISNDSPIIIDCGAYLGLSIVYFKKRYPNSKIIAFEPNPNVFPFLEENVTCNRLENVTLYNVALGRKKCTRDFYIDSSGIGAFSTSSFNKDAWNGKQRTKRIGVSVDMLSNYINSNVDLVKIDIEGAEMEVMDDLAHTKKVVLVDNYIIEFHQSKKNRLDNLTNLLEKYRYFVDIKPDKEDNLFLVYAKRNF